jgi:hypothetical protein
MRERESGNGSGGGQPRNFYGLWSLVYILRQGIRMHYVSTVEKEKE